MPTARAEIQDRFARFRQLEDRKIELGGRLLLCFSGGGPRVPRAFRNQRLHRAYVIHRDARWFEDPLSFRPERWLDGLATELPRFAYFLPEAVHVCASASHSRCWRACSS